MQDRPCSLRSNTNLSPCDPAQQYPSFHLVQDREELTYSVGMPLPVQLGGTTACRYQQRRTSKSRFVPAVNLLPKASTRGSLCQCAPLHRTSNTWGPFAPHLPPPFCHPHAATTTVVVVIRCTTTGRSAILLDVDSLTAIEALCGVVLRNLALLVLGLAVLSALAQHPPSPWASHEGLHVPIGVRAHHC